MCYVGRLTSTRAQIRIRRMAIAYDTYLTAYNNPDTQGYGVNQ